MLQAIGIEETGTMLLLGLSIATALFYLAIFWGLDRKQTYLFIAAFCLAEAWALLSLAAGYTIPFLVGATLANLALLYFFASYFGISRSRVVGGFAAVLVAIALLNGMDAGTPPSSLFMLGAWFAHALTLMAGAWIALRATREKKIGGNYLEAADGKLYSGRLLSITTALIFVLNVAFVSDAFFVSSAALSLVPFILVVTYLVFSDIRRQNEQLRSLKIKAVQLENEMLKTTIQPHFLINTLTVLSEWIEAQPALAVRQIDLLSKEFRYITRVAGEDLIRIEEELESCRVHLAIFNAKKSRHYLLETRGITPGFLVPPMAFHTLVENGLTHASTQEGRFLVEQEEGPYEHVFRVSSAPCSQQPPADGEGVGMTYVRARLEQAYPGRWKLHAEVVENSWVTTIQIAK